MRTQASARLEETQLIRIRVAENRKVGILIDTTFFGWEKRPLIPRKIPFCRNATHCEDARIRADAAYENAKDRNLRYAEELKLARERLA